MRCQNQQMVLASHGPRIYTYAKFFLWGYLNKISRKKLFYVKTMSNLEALTVFIWNDTGTVLPEASDQITF
jgi:hypothetical protein